MKLRFFAMTALVVCVVSSVCSIVAHAQEARTTASTTLSPNGPEAFSSAPLLTPEQHQALDEKLLAQRLAIASMNPPVLRGLAGQTVLSNTRETTIDTGGEEIERLVNPPDFVIGKNASYTIIGDGASLTAARFSEPKGDEVSKSQRVQRPSALMNFEQFAVYWTEEPGWHTELQLRNNLAASELIVTPALRSADGTEASLAPVAIHPGDVVTVPLHEVMMKSAPQFLGTYGSVVLRYRAPVVKALYAVAMIHLEGHPIAFHADAYPQPKDWVSGSREGIWRLLRQSATDYLILTNTADRALNTNLVLRDSNGKSWQQKLALSARQTARLSVRSLLEISQLGGSYGGITVEVAKDAGYLDTLHFMFDEIAGSSAVMKMFDRDPKTTLAERAWGGLTDWTIRAPMLALTQPDASLGFPPDIQLQPEIFLRNVTAQQYRAEMHFSWRSASTSGRSQSLSLSLKPYQTLLVDVAALQTQNVLPLDAQWASVFISIPGVQPDQLIAVAASYDTTERYGAQTPFNDQLAAHWEGDQWQADATHNTIITAGNGGTKPVPARLTLLHNNGKGVYEIERTLAPEEQMWIDVAQLIRSQAPDKNGRTVPPGETFGAYRLEESGNVGIGNLFEGKLIIDKTYGEATYGCMVCCAPAHGIMDFDPLTMLFSADGVQDITGTDACTGLDVNMTGEYTTWWTGNTAIATAAMSRIHGVSMGSTTHYARGTFQWGDGQARHASCPSRTDTTQAGTDVCDYTITPASLTSGDCTNGTRQSQNFATNFFPDQSQCIKLYKGTGSCGATASANVEIAVGSPTCHISALAPPSASVDYFSGPKRADGTAGTINMNFTVDFIGRSVSHSDPATVSCP